MQGIKAIQCTKILSAFGTWNHVEKKTTAAISGTTMGLLHLLMYRNLSQFFILFMGFNIALALPPAFAMELKIIDSYGNWTLDKLGYSHVVFTGKNYTESYTVKYVLPQNASQGTENWYLIKLNFIIEFSGNSTDGYAYVSASTNNWSSALIKFEVKRNHNNSLLINWSEIDLLGVSKYSSSSPKINISFANYIPYKGISPGINTLTFKLEQQGAKIKKLEILPTSGIEFTSRSPPNLTLNVKIPEDSIREGDSFIINFTLKNVGNYEAKKVKVHPIYPAGAFELVGEKLYYAPFLRDKLEGDFEFKAVKKGEYEIRIITETESGIHRPSVRIFVPVKDVRSNNSYLVLLLAIISFSVVGYFFRRISKI